jgi:hypothetical protein
MSSLVSTTHSFRFLLYPGFLSQFPQEFSSNAQFSHVLARFTGLGLAVEAAGESWCPNTHTPPYERDIGLTSEVRVNSRLSMTSIDYTFDVRNEVDPPIN